jgi:DNA-binding NarL/FixJ family response regulator
MPFTQARLQLCYGAFLRRSGKRGTAAQHLDAARETMMRLEARPYLKRCDQELAACGRTPAEMRLAPSLGLTPQEHAVARLVTKGLTNRQVARELILSVKTVEYHLGHVYTKLGVTSRIALANKLAGSR